MTENQVTLQQALYETRRGDPERALAMWREILHRDQHNGPAQHISGLLCMKLELFAEAEAHFRKAVGAQPENWEYHKDLGMAIESRKGVQASIDHFRRSIMDCRSNPDMYVILAGQLLSKGSHLAALDAIEAALRLEPTYVQAWIERSRALVHLNDLESAGASLAMARYLDTQSAPGQTPDWARGYSFMWSAPPRQPKLGARSVAVCMTGSCEVLQYTAHNLRMNLLDRLSNFDLFMVTPDDGHAHYAERLKPTKLSVGQQQHLPEEPYLEAFAKSNPTVSLQATLRRLSEMKQVSDLMDTVKTAYDAVIYVCPSAWIKHSFPDISRVDISVLRTPHQDLRGGLNGKYAVGSFHDMDVYLNQLDAVAQNPERLAMGPARGLMRHLIQSGVIPVLDPRLEIREAQIQSGRMVLKAPDWMVPSEPVHAPA